MPPMQVWVQPLIQWGTLLQTMGKDEATTQVWPNEAHVRAWIENGTALLTHCRVAGRTTHALVELMSEGTIDAHEVERLLALQGWEHTTMSDYDYGGNDNAEYFPLLESWQIAVGNATVLERGQFQVCDARAHWLNQGLGLFELNPEDDGADEGIPLIDGSHMEWIQKLCRSQPWARQTVAHWMLDEPRHSPAWDWVFGEELGQLPSADFLDSILQLLDERAVQHRMLDERDARNQMDLWAHDTLCQERLNLLAQQAPVFFQKIQELHSMHLTLYGGVPKEFQASRDYLMERAQLLAGTMAQRYTGNAESLEASTNPSMGKLFCDDAPSMAF